MILGSEGLENSWGKDCGASMLKRLRANLLLKGINSDRTIKSQQICSLAHLIYARIPSPLNNY
jgi:hypothetical protein